MKDHFNKIKNRGFYAADTSDLFADWVGLTSEEYQNRFMLVKRSRNLAKVNPIYARYLDIMETHVIGPDGIGIDLVDISSELEERILDEWNKWCMKCSTDGRWNWVDIQQLSLKFLLRDGEVFIIKHKLNNGGFKIQLLETEFLAEFDDEKRNIRSGIRLNSLGAPVTYFFWRSKPNFTHTIPSDSDLIIVPAQYVLHIAEFQSTSQLRGIPHGIVSFTRLHHLDHLIMSELMRARVNASRAFVIERDRVDDDNDVEYEQVEEIVPLATYYLNPGERLVDVSPKSPTQGMDTFHKSLLKQIFSGLGIGYAVGSNDYSEQNYSSLRQSMLQDQDTWKKYQNFIIRSLCYPVFEEFLKNSSWAEYVDYILPRVVWRPRRWQWVDPLKQIAAYREMLEIGVISRKKICSELGYDFDTIVAELKAEKEQLRDIETKKQKQDKLSMEQEEDKDE